MNALEQRVHNLIDDMRNSPLFTDERKEELVQWEAYYLEQARDIRAYALGYLHQTVMDHASERDPPDERFWTFISPLEEMVQLSLPEGVTSEAFLLQCEILKADEEEVQGRIDDRMESLIAESTARSQALQEGYDRLKAQGEGLERKKLLDEAEALMLKVNELTSIFARNAEKLTSFTATLKKFENTVLEITEELKKLE